MTERILIEGKKHKNTKSETAAGTVKASIPQDDTYVQMNQYATNLTMSDTEREKAKNQYEKEHSREKAPETITRKITEKDIGSKFPINNTDYILKEIINEPNGFQALIFTHPDTGESTLAIAGSYGFAKILKNPIEWDRDWIQNNLEILLKHLPPQLDTAMKVMDENKNKYNITAVTGYSLGAILAGMIAKMERNKDVKAYLYNGGLPQKLIDVLYKNYINQINNDSSNIVTMLNKDETLTNQGSIVEGSGIFEATKGEKGHDLREQEGLTDNDYKRLKIQTGKTTLDTLNTGLSSPPIGNGAMYNINSGFGLKDAKKIPESNNTEADQNIKKTVIKKPKNNLKKQFVPVEEVEKTLKKYENGAVPTGFAADITDSANTADTTNNVNTTVTTDAADITDTTDAGYSVNAENSEGSANITENTNNSVNTDTSTENSGNNSVSTDNTNTGNANNTSAPTAQPIEIPRLDDNLTIEEEKRITDMLENGVHGKDENGVTPEQIEELVKNFDKYGLKHAQIKQLKRQQEIRDSINELRNGTRTATPDYTINDRIAEMRRIKPLWMDYFFREAVEEVVCDLLSNACYRMGYDIPDPYKNFRYKVD